MDDINRVMTPMELFEEDLRLPLAVAARQRHKVQRSVEETHAPFVIGSINLMNEKIQHWSGTLHAHPAALRVETRARDSECSISTCRERLRQQVMQIVPVRHGEKWLKNKRSDAQPKLVELQQYPGFSVQGATPLPNVTALNQIFHNVLRARKQTGYLAEFRQLFSSTLMRDLLLDIFWWLFLHMYQTNYTVQSQLFNRISKNYVELIMKTQSCYYGDRFLEELSSTLSQAVYTSFCCSFPQSWIQFNNGFKSQVCNIVYQWVGGIRPAPGIYNNWNCNALLPQEVKDMKSRTSLDTNQRGINISDGVLNRSSSVNLDAGSKKFSSSSGSSAPSVPRKSIITSSRLSQRSVSKEKRNSRVQHKPSLELLEDQSSQFDETASSSSDSQQSVSKVSTINFGFDQVSPHQQPSVPRKSIITSLRLSQRSVSKEKRNSRVQHMPLQVDRAQFDEKALSSHDSQQSVRKVSTINYRFNQVSPHKQSQVARRGPEFMKNLFNLFGHSPLVLNFLQSLNLEPRCGENIYVTRTEIQRLPQDNAPTYNDVIKAGNQNLLKMKEKLSQQQPSGFFRDARLEAGHSIRCLLRPRWNPETQAFCCQTVLW
uniref:protein FAM227A-like isoform X2 n=1 Tax=Pristiophorus japonicus TaxID=55135 RepID=UPI00398E4B11